MGNGRYTRILSTNLGLIASRVLTIVFDHISTPIVFPVRNAREKSYLNPLAFRKKENFLSTVSERFRTTQQPSYLVLIQEGKKGHAMSKKIGIQRSFLSINTRLQ